MKKMSEQLVILKKKNTHRLGVAAQNVSSSDEDTTQSNDEDTESSDAEDASDQDSDDDDTGPAPATEQEVLG